MKKINPLVHWEPAINADRAMIYCMKEETRVEGPWEFGERPIQRSSKTDWQHVKDCAVSGNLEDIPPDVYVQHYSNLQKIRKDNLKPTDCGHLRGIWIYGESGIGKSRKAREDYPDAYPKMVNKWWDGYQGQKNVIMDDIDEDHKFLGHHLKIWGDRYGFIQENKGGALIDGYVNFVVTSQYSIEEIWEGKPRTIKALKRRYKVIHMTDPFQLGPMYGPENQENVNPNLPAELPGAGAQGFGSFG